MSHVPRTPRELDGDELLAAEFVLGVLDPAERAAVSRRALTDGVLAGHLAGWQRRLSGLAEDIAEVEAPAGAWNGIRRRAGLGADARARHRVPWWEQLAVWRGLSAAGLAGTLASILWFGVLRPGPAGHEGLAPLPHPLRLVATALSAGDQPLLVAGIDADACTLVLMPAAGADLPAGKVPYVWLRDPQGRLQVLAAGDRSPLQLYPVPLQLRDRLQAGRAVYVSLEPADGTRRERPAGTLAAARLARL